MAPKWIENEKRQSVAETGTVTDFVPLALPVAGTSASVVRGLPDRVTLRVLSHLPQSVCSSVEGMRRWHESHYFPCDGLRMINEKIVRRVPQPDHFDMCAILAECLDLLAARCTDRLGHRQQDPSLLGWELPDSIQVQITGHEEERRFSDAALKVRAGFHVCHKRRLPFGPSRSIAEAAIFFSLRALMEISLKSAGPGAKFPGLEVRTEGL